MRLVGDVRDGSRQVITEDRSACAERSEQVRLRPPAGENTLRLVRIAEPLLEPVEHDQLHDRRPGIAEPAPTEDVAAVCDQIPEHGLRGGGARHVPHEAWMVGVLPVRDHLAQELVDEVAEVPGALGAGFASTDSSSWRDRRRAAGPAARAAWRSTRRSTTRYPKRRIVSRRARAPSRRASADLRAVSRPGTTRPDSYDHDGLRPVAQPELAAARGLTWVLTVSSLRTSRSVDQDLAKTWTQRLDGGGVDRPDTRPVNRRKFAVRGRGKNDHMILLVAVLLAIVLLALGIAVIGLTIKLVWWALIGLVIGGLGRLLLPGAQPVGMLATAALGVAAAILGGIIAHALDAGSLLQFLIAIAVAAGLIAVYGGTRFHRPV